MEKLLVIISSGRKVKEKALIGLMFPTNKMKYKLAEDVEIVFIGPSKDLLVGDEEHRNTVLSSIGEYNPWFAGIWPK